MKKTILTLCLLLSLALGASAQQLKIGYFSYSSILEQLPEYSVAISNLDTLRTQYAAELKAAEEEFNEKYELFLDQQATLADAIKQKRMADLQALLERNVAFRKESERLLKQAEDEALAPLRDKIQAAIQSLGETKGYIILVNTDSDAVPYFSPAFSEDVTQQIIKLTK